MRVMSAVVSLIYGLAFVVVCLGGCLAPTSSGTMPCCADEAGFKAPSADCCKVVSGVRDASTPTLEALVPHAVPIQAPAETFRLTTAHVSLPRLNSSPPLVLRI
jgi:hypothetical protein